uniref:Uncharacterized protein n=1 Tax=Arundo donax TaxID=35708 RepID=A0A0A8ZS84_ARUDO
MQIFYTHFDHWQCHTSMKNWQWKFHLLKLS